MSDSFISRIRFPKGAQRRFIEVVQGKSTLSLSGIASILGVSTRTLSDWKREKFFMTDTALSKLCALANVPRPSGVEELEKFWNVQKAGLSGGKAKYAKYGKVAGSENSRKKKWQEWLEKDGRNKIRERFTKPIRIPEISERLAEFVGIMLGDGGITPYQIKITLDAVTDKEYAVFVCSLIEELFNVKPGKRYRTDSRAVDIFVSRTNLVQFCTELGLPIGNKIRQKISIPKWILENPKYSLACVRGLVDTDGCFFMHRYKIDTKHYAYPKVDFTSRSRALLLDVATVLQNQGFYVKLSPARSYIRIESREGFARYVRIFGTSNPKHQKKIESYGDVSEWLNDHLC